MPIPQQLDELLIEAEEVFAVSVLAIAKQTHRDTGEREGTFPCPRCHRGTVAWSVVPATGRRRSPGLIAVVCSTTWSDETGRTYRCTEAVR